jgi:hypothetical protein
MAGFPWFKTLARFLTHILTARHGQISLDHLAILIERLQEPFPSPTVPVTELPPLPAVISEYHFYPHQSRGNGNIDI